MVVEVTVKRNDGTVETVDMSGRFGAFNQFLFDRIKSDTKKSGRGEVLNAIVKQRRNNEGELRREYRNIYNEGADDGFEPDSFVDHPRYREWTEEVIFS